MNPLDIASLLRALVQADIEFIVVGGVASLMHGADVATRDLDIVPKTSEENARRLYDVLEALDVRVRDPAGRTIRPTLEHLAGKGQLLLSTRLGPLDVLGALHDGRGYDDLRPKSVPMNDGELTVRVLDLPTLIEVKAKAGRPKDRIALPLLLALLEDQDQSTRRW